MQYHIPEKRWPAAGEAFAGEDFFILTSVRFRASDVLGQTVWLFTGEGRSPRRYFLAERFLASEVAPSPHPDYRWMIRGKEGQVFEPPVEVTGRLWFLELLRVRANFSLGFGEIKNPAIIEALLSVGN